MARILVFSGSGVYADPWHPFRETSAAVAALLGAEGHEVTVRESDPGSLEDVSAFDVVVVNSGGRTNESDPAISRAWAADHHALEEFYRRGGPILGLHTAVGTFPDWDGWEDIIGGRWTEKSFHPPMSEAVFSPADAPAAAHPVWSALDSVSVVDERYSFLECASESKPLVSHVTDGVHHTMGWAASENVIYDGLGHDARSYASASRRKLLNNEVLWLLERRNPS